MSTPTVETIANLFAGAVIGTSVTILTEEFIRRFKRSRIRKKRMQNINKINEDLRSWCIAPQMEVLQFGPFRKDYLEPATDVFPRETTDDLVVEIEPAHSPHPKVRKIISNYSKKWHDEGQFEGSDLAGVTGIRYPRIGTEEKVALKLTVRPFKFFEFLATNANLDKTIRNDVSDEEREWLVEQAKNGRPDSPISTFANPLGVDLMLLCEGGRKMVLQKRSGDTSVRKDRIYPSVAETASITRDRRHNVQNEIDVFETVKFGLREELGIDIDELDALYFTSLYFDHEIRDYKLTAVAISYLDENSVVQRAKIGAPKDRYEMRELIFFEFPLKQFNIMELSQIWAPETMITYMMTIRALRGGRPQDMFESNR